MEYSIKKSKKKKIAYRTDDEDDDVITEQSKKKKKAKKEFGQENSSQEKDESDTHSKKIKKKKTGHISNNVEEKGLNEQLRNKKDEEFYQSDSVETKDEEVDSPSKKIKKRKNDYFPSIIEENQLTEQSRSKKNSKKTFSQLDNIETNDDEIQTPSKKTKKKKTNHTPNIKEEPVQENFRNKNKQSKESNEINNIETVHSQTRTDEHRIPPLHKEEIDGDSWQPKDYLELIRRMETQLSKLDTLSFDSRAERLDWNKIQFEDHSIEECKEKWKLLRSKIRHYRILSEVLQDAKKWVENPWSSTSHKRQARHPEQPTRPLSSYMLFYMDKKHKIIKKNPNLKVTEISRLVGDKFKALSERKKAYYIEKAKQMQEEYKEKLLKFHEKYPQLVRNVATKKVATSSKPLTPFKLYLNDKLQKHEKDQNFNRHDCTEKYKELWKNLSTKKKVFWIRLAKEEEEKYWEQLHDALEDGADHVIHKSILSKEENNILDREAGKPEKPPRSAYSLFSKLMLQNKDDNSYDGEPKNRMKEVAIKWKELPEEQKKAYAEEVQHLNEIYKLEFANYLENLPEDKRAEELLKFLPKKRPVKLTQKNFKAETSSPSKKEKHVEPEKPPVTAWDLYKTEFIEKNSHLPSNVAYKKAAATWKTLSSKEVEKYKNKHEQIKEKYLVDFEAFLKRMSEDELKEYYALKGVSEHELNEESAEEESSLEDEENDDAEKGDSEDSDSDMSE